MPILFLLFWIIINGKITLEIVLFGIAVSAGVSVFLYKVMGYKPSFDIRLFKRLPLWIAYIGLLIVEIIKANLQVIRIMFKPSKELHPAIVSFTTDLKSETARVTLANSITLTPGTITASMIDGEYKVHCLDKSLADGITDSSFVKMLRKIERIK